MLYWLNVIFDSNKGLVLFRQTQIFKSTLALINPIFTVSQPKILQINLPKLQTSVNFFSQVSFPTRDFKRNWAIVPNDWKCKIKKKLLKNPFSRSSVLTTVVLGRQRTFKNHSSEEIHVTLQPDNTKYKPFQFIPWSNFIERLQNLSPGIWSKFSTD